MIVRISGEGQYRLPDDGDAERLNELDNEAVEAVEKGDEPVSRSVGQMLELVRLRRQAAARDELVDPT